MTAPSIDRADPRNDFVGPLPVRTFCAPAAELRDPEALDQFARWGWAPLVGGCVLIAVVVLAAWEIALQELGVEVDRELRAVFIARALVTSAFLAAWVGLYVVWSRRRIERARAAVQAREAEVEAQAVRNQQLAALGALSRILAHEIKNPLNSMHLNCVVMERSLASDDRPPVDHMRQLIKVQSDQIARLNRLVEEYLRYGRERAATLDRRPLPLLETVGQVLELHRVALEQRGIETDVVVDGALPRALVDRHKIEQVLHNLVRNALEAPAQSRLELRLATEPGWVVLTVTDDGPGFLDPAAAFRPFYTTKDDGHGLGLALVRDILSAHGGDATACNVMPHGARIVLRLPASQGEA